MNEGLLPLRPPPAPAEGLAGWPLWLVLLPVLALAVALLYRRSRPWRARLRLRRLRRAFAHGRLPPREAADALAGVLHERFGKRPPHDGAQWQAFSARLAAARFSRDGGTTPETLALLDQASAWLAR